jgi:hypothetical protein
MDRGPGRVAGQLLPPRHRRRHPIPGPQRLRVAGAAADLPHWRTVWGYVHDWHHSGATRRVHDELREQVRVLARRRPVNNPADGCLSGTLATNRMSSQTGSKRDQFSRKNAVHRAWSRSAALNAATSGPVSHKIMLTRPRPRRHGRDRSDTCRGYDQGPQARGGSRSEQTDAPVGPEHRPARLSGDLGAHRRSYPQCRWRCIRYRADAPRELRGID